MAEAIIGLALIYALGAVMWLIAVSTRWDPWGLAPPGSLFGGPDERATRRHAFWVRLDALSPSMVQKFAACSHREQLEQMPESEWLSWIDRQIKEADSKPRWVHQHDEVISLIKKGWAVRSHTQRCEPICGVPTAESWILTPPPQNETRGTP